MSLVISIAGSDPGRGAGLQMDEKVCRELGVPFHGIIALDTVQDLSGLHEVTLAPAADVARALGDFLRRHFKSKNLGTGRSRGAKASDGDGCSERDGTGLAVKTGALGDADLILAIAETLNDFPSVPLVVDPVCSATLSTTGAPSLLTADGWAAMQSHLFPLATVVTPNTREYGDGSAYAKCRAVFLKGGHAEGNHVEDILLQGAQSPMQLRAPRLSGGTEIHGTGCALSTAIAAFLAQTGDLQISVQAAHKHMHQWIADALQLKQRHGLTTVDLLTDGIWKRKS